MGYNVPSTFYWFPLTLIGLIRQDRRHFYHAKKDMQWDVKAPFTQRTRESPTLQIGPIWNSNIQNEIQNDDTENSLLVTLRNLNTWQITQWHRSYVGRESIGAPARMSSAGTPHSQADEAAPMRKECPEIRVVSIWEKVRAFFNTALNWYFVKRVPSKWQKNGKWTGKTRTYVGDRR